MRFSAEEEMLDTTGDWYDNDVKASPDPYMSELIRGLERLGERVCAIVDRR